MPLLKEYVREIHNSNKYMTCRAFADRITFTLVTFQWGGGSEFTISFLLTHIFSVKLFALQEALGWS